ncbi:hypothetical protein L6452_12932 [Arctium lappa]|uniref:Uncharacterized protein n=1 Tax=Arctium lappa TaxID=4217 RepID=A0ACB9CGU6_ARCLA|nr:hypothetical protein L6452_12932 [Arctium lappa]
MEMKSIWENHKAIAWRSQTRNSKKVKIGMPSSSFIACFLLADSCFSLIINSQYPILFFRCHIYMYLYVL